DGVGVPVFDFTYDDAGYPTTDGDGFSLVTNDPTQTSTTIGTAAGWKISGFVDGSPAKMDSNTPLHVTSTNDVGTGSLRQAILDANAEVTAYHVISLEVAGSGTQILQPLSALPHPTMPLVVDVATGKTMQLGVGSSQSLV